MFKQKPIYKNFPFMEGSFESFQEDKKSVFILMPFGKTKKDKEIFKKTYFSIKHIIEDICFNGGILRCSRADFESGLIIMNDICKRIKKANLTIFDISLPNTNVYYELGLACGLDKKIILLYNHSIYYEKHPKDRLPFDINQFRYIEYHTISDLGYNLREKVESIVFLEDTSKVDINKVYKKVQKITRHFKLDTLAEQIKEDNDISDFELSKASDVLDEYFNDPKIESNDYKGVNYTEVSNKIRSKIGYKKRSKIKYILKCLYYDGFYSRLIAQLEYLPAELKSIQRDFLSNE